MLLTLGGCEQDAGTAEQTATAPAGQYMAALRARCGKAYRGKVTGGQNAALADKELQLAIAPCPADGPVTLALHANVGPLQVRREEEIWDRSRSVTLRLDGGALTATLGDRTEAGAAGPADGVAGPGSGTANRQSFALKGTDQTSATGPLVIALTDQDIMIDYPGGAADEGFSAAFNATDRVAMPPPAWGQPAG